MKGSRSETFKMNKKERKEKRELLRQLNRRCLDHLQKKICYFDSCQGNKKINPDQFLSWIQPEHQLIIDTYQGMTFHPIDLPSLIALLNSDNLFQLIKSVVAILQLSQSFQDQHLKELALASGIIPGFANAIMKTNNRFVKVISVRLLVKIIRQLSGPEHTRFVNLRTVPFTFLVSLLKSLSQIQSQLSLDLVRELFQKGFQLRLISEKEEIISALNFRLQNFGRKISQTEFYTILKIFEKIHLVNCEESEVLMEKVCSTLNLVLQRAIHEQCYNMVAGLIEVILISRQFIQSINSLLAKESVPAFVTKYSTFCTLFLRIIKTKSSVHNVKRVFYISRPLIKYLSNAGQIQLMQKLGVLRDIETLLLLERVENHSDDWQISFSCLTILERLFSKNHKETKRRFELNQALLIKMKELYSVQDKSLFQQLNKTVSKMISAKNSMHLLDLLQRTGIIREFLRPSKEVKAKQEFALQSMKETYERLEKRTFRDQAQFMELLRKSICQSMVWTVLETEGGGIERRELVGFYRRLFQSSNHQEMLFD